MAKDNSIDVTTIELHPDDASDYPIAHPNDTHITLPELPPRWPAEPHALTNEPTTERWLLAYDITLCLIPLALMAKAILCIVAYVIDKNNNGYLIDEVHALTTYLIRFNHQLATIFTVVFILIITTVVRRLALYMAQEGATVAKLEQLQASVSLPGTLKAIWSLRSFGRTSMVLVMLWAWFYLGSQASTSEYEYSTSGTAKKVPIAFFGPDKQSIFFANHSTAAVADVTISNLNSMYNIFSTTAGSKNGAVAYDLRGAALTPYLNADRTPWVGGSVLKEDRHHYVDVSTASKVTYTSWAGTTTYAIPDGPDNDVVPNGMDGRFTFNTTYFNATCTGIGVFNASSFPKGTNTASQVTINQTAYASPPPLGALDPPLDLEVWGRVNDTGGSVKAICQIRQIPVELKASCVNNFCGAKKMRFTPGTRTINRTVFDDANFTSSFFENFLTANGIPAGYTIDSDSTKYSSIAGYIFYGMNTLVNVMISPDYYGHGVNLSIPLFTDDTNLSNLMTMMINTYYQMSLDPTQGTFNDDNVYNPDPDMIKALNTKSNVGGWSVANLKGSPYLPKYRLSIPWIIVDLISCKILLAAALSAFWLRKRTLAPDIFGYVSSLTRDNPHLNLPDGGSTMSGLERARALKNVKVRIADVGDGHGFGKVGLRHAADFDVEMAHLKRDRHYV